MRPGHHLARTKGSTPAKSPIAMILGFVPVLIFAVLANISQDLALWAAFAAAFAVGIRDFAREQMLRLLDVGSTVLFGALALYAGFLQPAITIEMTRLVVDIGFCLLAFASILLRSPFTLQYAREQAPRELWGTRRFVLANYALTLFWALAFAGMAAADAISNIHKELPRSFDAAVGLVVLIVAVALTARYPAYLRARAAQIVWRAAREQADVQRTVRQKS
jgi:hypothetical protein